MFEEGVERGKFKSGFGKRKINPRHTGRKHGRFASMYTPTEADIKLLQKHDAIEAIEGMSPKEIEVFMDRLRMVGSKRKSNPKGRIKQKKAKRKLPIKKGVLTPIPDDIEIERLPMGVAQGHDTFRQREFMHSPITSSKGHYRTRKPNPKSWDKVVKGAVQNMSDKELVALHKKQSKKLHSSHAPERQFGTEGVKMLESTIELTEKEISRRGLSPRKLNPSKPLSSKRRKYMTPVDWAKLNMKNYHKHMKAFDSSMEVDDPDYSCLIAANLDAYGAEINYRDAGDKKNANKMMTERKRISKELSTLLK